MCSQTVGVSAMASITSGVKSCGCGLVNRTLRMPSTAPTVRRRSANSGRARRSRHGDVAAVGVDVLPEQRDLHDASGREALHLAEDVADRARALRSSYERHDAERARVVAPGSDRDPRSERIVPYRGQGARERLGVFPDVHLRSVGVRALEQLQELRQRLSADHHVDPRSPALDLPSILLCEAARHDDPQLRIRSLHGLQVAQVAVELVVRVLTDRTRVQHDDACVVDVARRRHPLGLEHACDPLGVVLVHLAPEGADLITAFHRDEGIRCPGALPETRQIATDRPDSLKDCPAWPMPEATTDDCVRGTSSRWAMGSRARRSACVRREPS